MTYSKYIAIALMLCGSLSAKETCWSPWVQIELDAATSKQLTRAEAEVFVPICPKSKECIVFGFAHASKYEKEYLAEAGGGLGIRKLCCKDLIIGANISYDGVLSEHKKWFNFLDIGTEAFCGQFDLRLDTRIPLGSKRKEYGPGPTVISTEIVNSEVRLNTKLRDSDVSAWSIGGEIGWRFPIECNKKFCGYGRVYAGGQWCNGDASHTTGVECATLGFELYNNELHQAKCGLQVTLGAELCTDFQRRADAVFSITFRQACKKKCTPCGKLGLLSRMDDPVVRRLRPCVVKQEGEVINEAATTLEYNVNGIWVAYESGLLLSATPHNLQTQLDLAFQNGGTSTMVFGDGRFTATGFLLNIGQVLAGGNANLTSVGKTTGAPIAWGNWGNKTTDPLFLDSSDSTLDLLTMSHSSAIDTATLRGGASTITNLPGANGLRIRKVDLTTTADAPAIDRFYAAIFLIDTMNCLVENANLKGGGFVKGGYVAQNCTNITFRNVESFDSTGHSAINCVNTIFDGLISNDDGKADVPPFLLDIAALTLVNNTNTTVTNFLINNQATTGITSGFLLPSVVFPTITGPVPSNTTISNGRVNIGALADAGSNAIFFGTNNGNNSITNVSVSGFNAGGIQVGGSASSEFTGNTTNMAISNVTTQCFDPTNITGGILVQNSIAGEVANASVNNSTIIGAGALTPNPGVSINAVDGVLNLSGTNNTILSVDPALECDPFVAAGVINGGITSNGSSCP